MNNLNNFMTLPGNQQMVQGIPIGRINNLDKRVSVLEGATTSSGYQSPTGTVNGVNKVFVFSLAPNALVVDGVSIRKVSSDGTVNWTGTTTITLSIAPNFDIYAVA